MRSPHQIAIFLTSFQDLNSVTGSEASGGFHGTESAVRVHSYAHSQCDVADARTARASYCWSNFQTPDYDSLFGKYVIGAWEQYACPQGHADFVTVDASLVFGDAEEQSHHHNDSKAFDYSDDPDMFRMNPWCGANCALAFPFTSCNVAGLYYIFITDKWHATVLAVETAPPNDHVGPVNTGEVSIVPCPIGQ